MGKYLYMLFVGMLLMFVTTIPVLATDVNQEVTYVMGIPNAPPEVLPPDLTIGIAYQVYHRISLPEPIEYPTPKSDLHPRPGWQNQSAAEAYMKKRETLLAEEINI